ncbi:S1 family peptidase [Goodfellowiella coeruleoviolacea]|uniref:Uncharacterized protein n=1 Tax=Goodfellowiella coeruleoviolacea TaxID=334858 RepID=A0AAE3GKY6_9PSEU|nr:S1 family peptidase [Goodfellowiella coeruleoviolacea]MCP2169392.1 hypothetical protein [Goodfellowiella coeruleoviolacea]
MRKWPQSGLGRSFAVVALAASTMLAPAPISAAPSGAAQAGDSTRSFAVPDPAALQQLITSRPTEFGGMFLDPATNTLVVQVVDGPSAGSARQAVAGLPRARAELSGLTTSTALRFHSVGRSKAELDRIKDRVSTDPAWSGIAGPVLSEWYVDVIHNRVAVGVTELTDAVRQAAATAFGSAVDLRVAPPAVATSKQVDSAPWTGGARIAVQGAATRECSSAFTVVETATGRRGGLTAGHCGDAVGNTVTNNGVSMGTVIIREYAAQGHDVAIYAGSDYQNRIYRSITTTGPVTGTNSFLLLGQLDICFGGWHMGDQNCDGKLTALDSCASFWLDYNPRYVICGLLKATSTKAGYLAYDGDSGGPVFQVRRPIGGGAESVLALGLIVGRPGQDHTSAYFHPINTVLPAGWQIATS